MSFFIDIILSGLMQAAPLALATLAIVLIFRTSFTTNFAQGMVGTLSGFFTTYILMPTPDISGNVPNPNFIEYILAIMAGVVVGFIVSMLIDVLIFRNAKYITHIGKQIVTMGIVLVISGIVPILFGISDRSLPRLGSNIRATWLGDVFLSITDGLRSMGLIVQLHQLIGFTISFIMIGAIFIALRYTKWGLGVRATASNERIASMMGVNTHFITAMSWAIAGALGAIAAILVSSSRGSFGNVTTYFMISIQVQAFFSAILGGFSTFYGPIIGVAIFSVVNSLFSVYLNPWGTTALYLFVMIVVLIKPLGLFGKKIAKKV